MFVSFRQCRARTIRLEWLRMNVPEPLRPPGRRERNKESKQRRLEAAGLSSFLAEGYGGASVERIAAEADVARGTFYLYFKDKEALFEHVMARFFEPLVTAVGDARDALARCPDAASTFPVYAELGTTLTALLVQHQDEMRLYFAEARAVGPSGDAVRRWTAQIERLTEEILVDAVGRGTLRPHHVRGVALAIVGGIERLVYGFLQGDGALDPTQVPAEVIQLFRYGLAPRDAPR